MVYQGETKGNFRLDRVVGRVSEAMFDMKTKRSGGARHAKI